MHNKKVNECKDEKIKMLADNVDWDEECDYHTDIEFDDQNKHK